MGCLLQTNYITLGVHILNFSQLWPLPLLSVSPRSHFVAQTGFELQEVLLLLLPNCWG